MKKERKKERKKGKKKERSKWKDKSIYNWKVTDTQVRKIFGEGEHDLTKTCVNFWRDGRRNNIGKKKKIAK